MVNLGSDLRPLACSSGPAVAAQVSYVLPVLGLEADGVQRGRGVLLGGAENSANNNANDGHQRDGETDSRVYLTAHASCRHKRPLPPRNGLTFFFLSTCSTGGDMDPAAMVLRCPV